MKNDMPLQTIRIAAAMFWLALLPAIGKLAAQPFYTAEEALEEVRVLARDIESQVALAVQILPQLQEALEDGDFRAQGPLFKKLHRVLEDIESQSDGMGRSAEDAARLDIRLDVDPIRNAAIYIGTNEDYAALALLDAAADLHEGEPAPAEAALREARDALRAIRTFAQTAEDEARRMLRER